MKTTLEISKCPPVDIIECYTMKRMNNIQLHATTGINPTDIRLSERSKTTREDTCMS